MKSIALLLAALTLVACYGRSKTKIESFPIPSGGSIVIRETMKPGFLDSSIKRESTLCWPSGSKEVLPLTFAISGPDIKGVAAVPGGIGLPAGFALFYRTGSAAHATGAWQTWSMPSSPELFEYAKAYAIMSGNKGVTTTTNMGSLHRLEHGDPRLVVIDPSVAVTNESIQYVGTRYFVSPARTHIGMHLPHMIASVDTGTSDIVMSCGVVIPSMPRTLIFSPTNNPRLTWVFNRAKTEVIGPTK